MMRKVHYPFAPGSIIQKPTAQIIYNREWEGGLPQSVAVSYNTVSVLFFLFARFAL